MGDSAGRSEKAFAEWHAAEKRYAQALREFGSDGPPAKVRKDSAIELASLRSKADRLRDAYFRRALK